MKREVNPEIAEKMVNLYADLWTVYFKKYRDPLSYRKFGLLVANLHPEKRLYDPSTVATWVLYGQRPDDPDTQQAIAKAFGVNPGWLWFDSGPQYPDQTARSRLPDLSDPDFGPRIMRGRHKK